MAERPEKPPEGLPESAQPEETYKTPDPRAHYLELDGLRGIAILGVVIAHAANRWGHISESPLRVPLLGVDLLELLLLGGIGVPLFFLLSGYLLTWTEEKRRERGTYSVLNYAKRRALRIVPAYYVAIAVVLLVWPITLEGSNLERYSDPSFKTVALHLVFLQDFDPGYPAGASLDPSWWTLTPEILFYAMLPLLVLKLRKLWQRAMVLALLLLVSLAAQLSTAYDVFGLLPGLAAYSGYPPYFFPTTLLYLFLVGMLLRMRVERRTEAGHEPGHRQLFLASALTVVPVTVLLAVFYLGVQEKGLVQDLAPMITEAMVVLIFASVLMGSSILKPVLRWKPVVFFGEMSYSLFLLHNTILFTMDGYFRSTVRPWLSDQGEPTVWAAFFAYVLVVLAVAGTLAYLSFRYIESPFLRIKPK